MEWFAGDYAKLDRFAAGKDQYVDQAAAMYNLHEEAVTKAQRQAGKVVVLGCGYGQGAPGPVPAASGGKPRHEESNDHGIGLATIEIAH